MEIRNNCFAFNGTFELCKSSDNELHILRKYKNHTAELIADFTNKSFIILEDGVKVYSQE